MKKKILAGLAAAVCIGCLAGHSTVYAQNMPKDVMADGIFIDEVDMSGMTISEAVDAIDAYIEGKTGSRITLNINDNQVEVTAGDMGLSCGNAQVVEEAFEYGKEGNIVQRYKIMKDLQAEPHTFDLEFDISDEKIRSIIEEQCTVFDVKATDATVKKSGNGFEITPGVTGVKLDVEASISKVTEFMRSEWGGSDEVIDLVCELDEPRGTEEDFAKVKDVLGTFTTSFQSSGANRTKNVTNGVGKINGTILYPGDVFSVYEVTHPFTEANGYATATAYENGMEVDSVGGGICQVSTTLYNAVLNSELEVVERSNHSMIVGYVKPSMDAAIAGTHKDLKFKNSTDAPVYIEGYVSNKKATFTIYGHETRDKSSRKVTYESEVLETTQATPNLVYVGSGSKPAGYKAITQKAHTGYRAQLWKIVTVNGVEESREVINKSTYKAAPAYCTIGTFWADPAGTAEINAAIATQDGPTIDAVVAKYAAMLAAATAPPQQ